MDTLDKLFKLISATTRYEPYGQRGKYQPIADILNKISGRSWTWKYIRNIALYDAQMGDMMCDAIRVAYDKLNKKTRPRPDDDEIAKRTLVVYGTLEELHRAQKMFVPRERMEKLLGE